MKIRTGFVSNSSSSSFMVAVKGIVHDEKIKEILEKEVFFVPENSAMKSISRDIVECFMENMGRDNIIVTLDALDEWHEECGSDEDYTRYKDLIERGFRILLGSFSTDDGGIEELLTNVEIKYEDENIIIESDGYF